MFALRVLFTGGVMIVMFIDADLRGETHRSLLIPISTLAVLAIRGVGFWRLIKLRRSAPLWLLTAFIVSAIFSAAQLALIGRERVLLQQGPAVLIVEYTIALIVVGYAFSLRRRGVLKK
ncbi:MAG TPA: hypothetical protein VHO24_01815 [Opitutaceae bacterium]|nr:hypothetical protein [Opitutaceae bacterium]